MRKKPRNKKRKFAYFARMGRKGGKLGGKIRAAKLTPEQRKRIARIAAWKRWHPNEELPPDLK